VLAYHGKAVAAEITRRDFLDGVAIAIGAGASGALVPGVAAVAQGAGQGAAAQDAAGYYPPTLTGLRGDHPGSFETAHALRDGDAGLRAGANAATGEDYDLVIVGGGISGLAAAHFYRARRPDARVLVLDNHDDIGGHAKRNEFARAGRLALMNGGTYAIDSPRPYSAVADGLLRTLGIDPVALSKKCTDEKFYTSHGFARGIFFDRGTFGADKLVVVRKGAPWREVLAAAPLSEQARADIVRIEEGAIDYFPGLSSSEKKARLARMSYRDYLRDVVEADAAAIALYQARPHGEWGVGADAVSALDVWAFGFPGFRGLKLKEGSAPHMGYTAAGYADGGSYVFHFPDGNASIVRLLVRNLIADALPGSSAEDAVTARLDYARLDRAGAPVRIRLNATAVHVRHIGDPASADAVEVVYARGGALSSVRAQACVLACYNMIIPYLCPELPDRQKQALRYASKVPLIYVSVALRNWQAFKNLGVAQVYAPGSYFSSLALNEVVDIGGYAGVRSPGEPVLLHLERVPAAPGLPEREQHRIGRQDILATSFETYERNIRDQLDRILGSGGFDAARDITAITVNRWPHGYAYEYNPLFDPDWPPGRAPHEIGRTRFGRIAIANSDAGAAAYTDSAIDQAYRAVAELFGA
jgi:spermidine dehydrogenase